MHFSYVGFFQRKQTNISNTAYESFRLKQLSMQQLELFHSLLTTDVFSYTVITVNINANTYERLHSD